MSGESEARLDAQLQSIDSAMLTPLVRQTLGSKTAEITGWDTQQIYGGIGGQTAGSSVIYRISGSARDETNSLGWSLILKILYPPDEPDQLSDHEYWRREAHAYESGLLDELPGGLAAPRCFGVVDRPGQACWIWLEDVKDDIGPTWPLAHYGVVARHLGQFNGAYLTGKPIPSLAWLRQMGYLRRRVANVGPSITRLCESADDLLVRRFFPPDRVDILLRLWAEHEDYLDALDRLPRTLCHHDAFRRNLFARHAPNGAYETVLIDWAGVGIGWIGQEMAMLVNTTLLLREVDYADAKELDRIVFEGYLEGLRDAAWHGDSLQVRLGRAVGPAVGSLRRPGGFFRKWVDRVERSRALDALALSPDEEMDHLAEYLDYVFDLAREAQALMDGL